MQESQTNPFDSLFELIDEKATFDENVATLHKLLQDGKIDLQLVATIMMEASTIPHLAADNYNLFTEVKEQDRLIAMYEKDLREFSEERKEQAIACQDGMGLDEEKEYANKIIKVMFPKGAIVN